MRVCGTLLMPDRTAGQIRTGHGLMSAPTPGSAHGSPLPGYYPDPSIPGYIRYWNGGAWVPGTSRPAPKEGQDLPGLPPGGAVPPVPRSVPVPPPSPARGETGPQDRHGTAPEGGTGSTDGSGSGYRGSAAVPEPRRRDETDVGSPAGPDRKDSRHLHDSRPEPASAWGAAPTPPGSTSREDPRIAVAGPRSGDDGDEPRDGARTDEGDGSPETVDFGTGRPSRDGGGKDSTLTLRADGASHSTPDGRDDTPGTSPAPRPGAATAETPPAEGVPPQRDGRSADRGDTMTMTLGVPGTSTGAGAESPGDAPASGSSTEPGGAPAPGSPSARASASGRPGLPVPDTQEPGGGRPSWAQQAHPLPRPGAASPAREPSAPVTPWRPPVDDPFLHAAQAQASARPAKSGRRIVARLIDTVVLGALVAGVTVPLGVKTVDHIKDEIEAAKLSGETVTVWLLDGTTAGYLGIVLGALLLGGVLYEVLPLAKWGQTFGKRICRLEVLDIESHDLPTVGAALRRWLLFSVLGILAVGLLNVVWCLFDKPWRQCWHDKAAHTFVAGPGGR
jgi:uncharacterized RDD family membrane protein YckC